MKQKEWNITKRQIVVFIYSLRDKLFPQKKQNWESTQENTDKLNEIKTS